MAKVMIFGDVGGIWMKGYKKGYKKSRACDEVRDFLWWADMCYFTYTFWLPMM